MNDPITTEFQKDNLLSIGQETFPRELIASSAAQVSGTLLLSFFTARKSEPVRSMRYITVATAAVTPTLIRYGLYAVNEGVDLTLIGSTPNDLTLLAATQTRYPKNLSVPSAAVQGLRYAMGLLVVATVTMPTVAARAAALSAGGSGADEFLDSPRISAAVGSQANLPLTIAWGTLTRTSVCYYAAISPEAV